MEWMEAILRRVKDAVCPRLREWRRRLESRRALARLDDRMLRDIGLSCLDAQTESRKPFWKQ